MPNNNYLTFDQAKQLFQEVGYKFKRVADAYTVKGNATLATLPAASANTEGFVFNMTAEFTTTADFVEGAGKKYSAGTNVAIVDVTPITYTAVSSPAADANPKYSGWYEKDTSQDVYFLTADGSVTSGKTYYTATPGTAAYKYDVIANFVDVDGITGDIADVKAAIAPEYDSTAGVYKNDLVFHDGVLYQAKGRYTGEWPSTELDVLDHFTTLNNLSPIAGTVKEHDTLLNELDGNFAPEFSSSSTYHYGDIVYYEGAVYEFTTTHNGAWSNADATKTNLVDKFNIKLRDNTVGIVADGFDESADYSVGNVVMYDGKLYKFNTAQTGTDWTPANVDEVTVANLISSAEPEALTTTQMNTLIGLL